MKRNAANDVIVVLFQVWSGMPRFRRPCQSNPKSCPFRPHSSGEIHGQSLLATVCGLLSVFVGPMLLTPSDIATCLSKSDKWWFEKLPGSKHRDYPERPADLYACFPQPSRESRCKFTVSHFVFRCEFQCNQMKTPDTTLRLFFISMHDLPYTSVNWWWISIDVFHFLFKNRITAQTSHFAVVLTGTSITKGCQAKTKRPVSVCACLDGVGEWGKQHMQQCCQQPYKQFHSALETLLLELPL